MKQSLEKVLDLVFFRGEHVYQECLQTFSGDLTNVVGLVELIQVLRQYVVETLNPLSFHIFLFEPLIDQYIATPDENDDITSDIRFSANTPLVDMLNEKRSPILVTGTSHQKQKLQSDQARVELLGAEVLIPLPGRDQLAGWLVLGSHQMGESYSSRELGFLGALGDQATLAVERAQIISNMEDCVREMNMLTRVAQGINITLEHDDMLELIYAQTIQIIPADDFHIYLLDHDSPAIIMVFNVEDNERLTQREYKPVDLDTLLEREIVSQRRNIHTNDFSRECISRGIQNIFPEIYAWMGVPLNSGAETIGALSLGSRDPDIVYTQDLVNLLQAIADQVAGAIVKDRLLEETKRRAQQLASLNEVSKQLTSNLNYESLLQSILLNAVSILNSEAGSLLLIDEDTDELIFEVTVGPVADELYKKRLPSGSGLVGKSVKTGKPVIVNDVYKSQDWYEKSDQETGFVTRSLLVVPLEAKDTILGVIEVINKKDESPYNREDEQLLSAFAAQATIAIENARLYTMTDQALESRVEELSILQRIGQELNTSLDTNKTMQ
ncbi:MAG: GAF domain-containing protein, partial [Anaerolineaceae bacterium]|nr:GAF domain-containing protein [Anaerolineaceae bacterium]